MFYERNEEKIFGAFLGDASKTVWRFWGSCFFLPKVVKNHTKGCFPFGIVWAASFRTGSNMMGGGYLPFGI